MEELVFGDHLVPNYKMLSQNLDLLTTYLYNFADPSVIKIYSCVLIQQR